MAKMLAYGKRKPKKYSARQDKEKKREVKEPLLPPPPDHAVMHEGVVGDTPYEIVYSPFSGGISYSMSKPSVRIVAAVDRLPPDKSSHLIEYACKCREFYVEYHDNLNPGEKMSMPVAKKYACDKAMEWMSERYGSRTVQSVLKAFVLVFNGVVADEVEVDFLGDSEGVFLELVGGVVDDIEVPCETVTL